MSHENDREREDAALVSLLERARSAPPGRVESYGPHPDQVVEWYAPGRVPDVEPAHASGSAPVVVLHGGFFRPSIDRSHARPMAAALAERLRVPVILAEYRRVSGDPEASLADVATVSDLLEATFDEPCLWVGHSAGGTLVLLRAFDEVRPAVPTLALAPVADLGAAIADRLGDGAVALWLGPRTAAKPSRYAHLEPARLAENLPERVGGVVSLHGAADTTVPPSQSRSSGLACEVVPGAHHYDLIDPESAAWPSVLEAIQRLSAQR